MKWFLLFIFFTSPAFAQAVTGGQISPNIPPVVAQKNVTIIYNTQTGQPDSVVIDANNLNDPSFNQPGTRQVSIPVKAYNAIPDAATFQTYMGNSIAADVIAQPVMQ